MGIWSLPARRWCRARHTIWTLAWRIRREQAFRRNTAVQAHVQNHKKAKFPLQKATKAQRRCSYNSTLTLTSVLDGNGWLTPCPGSSPTGVTRYPLYESDQVPTVWEVRCVLGLLWTGAGKLVLTKIRSPNRPPRSDSLHRLCHPGPQVQTHCLSNRGRRVTARE